METFAAYESVGTPAWYVGLTLVAVALLGLAVLRLQPPEGRAVVVRRSRVARVPSRRLTAVVPVLERLETWPADLLELPLQVRAATADGEDVRVLVEVVVWVPPPRVGEPYADPCPLLDDAARALVASEVGARTAAALLDLDVGLAAGLGGHCLREPDGRALGVIATTEIAEVELLLRAAEDGCRKDCHGAR